MNVMKTHRIKARSDLLKSAVRSLEQILVATSKKTAGV